MTETEKEKFLLRLQHRAIELAQELFEKGGLARVHKGVEIQLGDHGTYAGDEVMISITVVNLAKREAWMDASLNKQAKGRALIEIANSSFANLGYDVWERKVERARKEFREACEALDKLTERMKA